MKAILEKNVREDDVEAKNRRATQSEYIRFGPNRSESVMHDSRDEPSSCLIFSHPVARVGPKKSLPPVGAGGCRRKL